MIATIQRLSPATRRLQGLIPLCLVLLAGLAGLPGCASNNALQAGERAIAAGKPREGLAALQSAMRAKPDDLQLRAAYLRQRDLRIGQLLVQAEAELKADQLEAAQASYREVLGLHPESPRASEGLLSVELGRRNREVLREAQAAFNRNDLEVARGKLRLVLAQEPSHKQAREMLAQVEARAGQGQALDSPKLAEAFRKPVTLEFRNAQLKQVFDALAQQSGLKFIFDKDVRLDQKTTLFAPNTPISDAIDMLLATNQLGKKTLNANTLLLYPNTPAKQRDYQDMVVRAFFLANADPKQVMALIKTMTKTKDVHVDEKLNLVVMRDTPEVVRLAEKLVKVADRPEPEVMLEVEILEVKRSKLTELGVQWPNQFGILNVIDTPVFAQNSLGVPTATGSSTRTLSTLPLTLSDLRSIDSSRITINPSPLINLNATDGDVNILANPRIRVKNKEKAKVHVGDKVPVITSNVTSTGVTSESVSFLEVGLKLDVEPQVYLEGEVGIKIGLEVSNIVQQIRTATGTLTYQLGSRNATTTLRLKDGETQVLAGLISDEERSSASKVPGLGDIPLLGRLFSSNRDDNSKSEIVLLITPRILRNIERPELADIEFFAGTDASASSSPLRLRPALGIMPANILQPREEESAPDVTEIQEAPITPNAPIPGDNPTGAQPRP
jgi:general secretion pathway protein D